MLKRDDGVRQTKRWYLHIFQSEVRRQGASDEQHIHKDMLGAEVGEVFQQADTTSDASLKIPQK